MHACALETQSLSLPSESLSVIIHFISIDLFCYFMDFYFFLNFVYDKSFVCFFRDVLLLLTRCYLKLLSYLSIVDLSQATFIYYMLVLYGLFVSMKYSIKSSKVSLLQSMEIGLMLFVQHVMNIAKSEFKRILCFCKQKYFNIIRDNLHSFRASPPLNPTVLHLQIYIIDPSQNQQEESITIKLDISRHQGCFSHKKNKMNRVIGEGILVFTHHLDLSK